MESGRESQRGFRVGSGWWACSSSGPRCPGVPLLVGVVPAGAGGQVVAITGGPQAWWNSSVQASLQAQPAGRCTRRAEVAIRAGIWMSLRRIVAVVALARVGPVIVAAARVRLNAMTAQTSHAAFAVKTPSVISSRAVTRGVDLR